MLRFLLLVLIVCEINTVQKQGPTQWKDLFHTQKWLHLITSKARSNWLLRGVGNELTQIQGQRGFILTVELYLTMVNIIPYEIHACM